MSYLGVERLVFDYLAFRAGPSARRRRSADSYGAFPDSDMLLPGGIQWVFVRAFYPDRGQTTPNHTPPTQNGPNTSSLLGATGCMDGGDTGQYDLCFCLLFGPSLSGEASPAAMDIDYDGSPVQPGSQT